MRLLSILSIFTFLSTTASAQDSTFIKLEQYKILNNQLGSYYNAPALKKLNNPVNYTDIQVNYAQQKSDDYIWQKGSGYNDFNVKINSFQQKKNNLNVWGSFQYNNSRLKAVNFNETLDYDYLYPYIMADTVGGNLTNEQYAISGGISKTNNRTTYALESSFVGKQSVRNRDPRTQNISSNFNVTLSVAQAISKKYSLGLSILGERYFQKAKVSFNSELGRPTIYHETGFGNYNKLFASTKDNAEYLGYNYGGSIHFVPNDQIGWFATAKYVGAIIDKRIKDVDFVINEAQKHDINAQLGYKFAFNSISTLEIGTNYHWNKLRGIEGKFHTQQSQLIELAKENLFNSTYNTVDGYVSYQHSKPNTTWTGTFRAAYSDEQESYVAPFNSQKFTFINLQGDLGLNQKIKKSMLLMHIKYNYNNPLTAEANWNSFETDSYRYAMLSNNFNYRNTQVSLVDFAVKIAVPVKKLQSYFIGGNVSYASAYNLTQFGITSGFVF